MLRAAIMHQTAGVAQDVPGYALTSDAWSCLSYQQRNARDASLRCHCSTRALRADSQHIMQAEDAQGASSTTNGADAQALADLEAERSWISQEIRSLLQENQECVAL